MFWLHLPLPQRSSAARSLLVLECPLELSTQGYAECKISPGSKRSDILRAREMAQRGKHVLCEQEDFMLIVGTHVKTEGGSVCL